MKMKRNRFLSLVLAVVMVIGMVPVSARAADESDGGILDCLYVDYSYPAEFMSVAFYDTSGVFISQVYFSSTETIATNLYKLSVPNNAVTVKFCYDTDSGSYTSKHTLSAQYNLFTITDLDYLSYTVVGDWGTYCAHEHTENRNVTDATCTAKGSYEVYCTDCEKTIGSGDIQATGHDWTESDFCKVCNVPHYVYIDWGTSVSYGTFEVLKQSWEALDQEHVSGTVYKVTNPDTENCLKLQWRDDMEFASSTVYFDTDGKIIYQVTEINSSYYSISGEWIACGHTYGTTEETIPATCFTPGTKVTRCAVCGYLCNSEEDESSPATGEHIYGEDGKCTADPNCTATDGLIRTAEELKAALADETVAEVKLGADITLADGEHLLITRTVTLDLNGHTIASNQNVTDTTSWGTITVSVNGGNLTINDSSEEKTGKIINIAEPDAYGYPCMTLTNHGILTINGGTFEGGYAVYNCGASSYGGTVTVNGGSFSSNSDEGYSIVNLGSASVSGAAVEDMLYSEAKLVVTSGEIESLVIASAYDNYPAGSTTSISGGTIDSLSVISYNDSVKANEVTVTGGEIQCVEACVQEGVTDEVMSTISISGGSIGTIESYSVDENYENTASDASNGVSVSGGTFSSPVGEVYCANGYVSESYINEEGKLVYGVNEKEEDTGTSAVLTSYGKSLVFEDIVQIRYYFSYYATNSDHEYDLTTEAGILVWNSEQEAYTVENASYRVEGLTSKDIDGNTYYYATGNGIPAKNWGDTVYACGYLKNDETYILTEVTAYSPLTYATNMLAKDQDTRFDALLVAMLNYGTAAQNHFGYDTENPVNAGLTDAEKVWVWEDTLLVERETVPSYSFTPDDNISFYGWSLLYEGAIGERMYSQISEELITGAQETGMLYWTTGSETVDGISLETAKKIVGLKHYKDDLYYATIPGTAAKDLAATYFACAYVVDSSGETHYGPVRSYSAHTYAKNMISSDSQTEALKDLCKTMVIYGAAANDWFYRDVT